MKHSLLLQLVLRIFYLMEKEEIQNFQIIWQFLLHKFISLYCLLHRSSCGVTACTWVRRNSLGPSVLFFVFDRLSWEIDWCLNIRFCNKDISLNHFWCIVWLIKIFIFSTIVATIRRFIPYLQSSETREWDSANLFPSQAFSIPCPTIKFLQLPQGKPRKNILGVPSSIISPW